MELSLRNAYTEVNQILDILGEKFKTKIPKKLLDFFEKNQNLDYHPNINPNIPIEEMNLLRDTLIIISILNLKYWEKDEEQREKLKEVYRNNQIDYQKKMGLSKINKIF
ncbi:MAG: hypothetical protein IJ629_03025 [Clostridia bacterium]|nr:hypothetical protein [Clostridia bacterium]